MRVAFVSANLGGMEQPVQHAPQRLPADVHVSWHQYDDVSFPPRPRSMTPRMQAKIPKVFAWKLLPGYDAYVWLDASFALKEDALNTLLAHLEMADMVMFAHPSRSSVAAEVQFLTKRLSGRYMRSGYIKDRYADEWADAQLAAYVADPAFIDNRLFACGCFAYRATPAVQALMNEWWWHISLYHVNDQLSFPYVLAKSRVAVSVINEDIYKCSFLTYMRGDR